MQYFSSFGVQMQCLFVCEYVLAHTHILVYLIQACESMPKNKFVINAC